MITHLLLRSTTGVNEQFPGRDFNPLDSSPMTACDLTPDSSLNEKIARAANKEDECTGHFWESRYKSQALLDEKAVLSCMAYVDLNPVRAGMADTPELSDYTSIQLRIKHWKSVSEEQGNNSISDNDENAQPKSLLPFAGNLRQPMPKGIIYNLLDYLELIDWTGRQIREKNRIYRW